MNKLSFVSNVVLRPTFMIPLLIFFEWSSATVAQISPNLAQAYHQTTKLRLGVAKQYLAKEKNNQDAVAVAFGQYVENYADMVTLLVSDDPALFSQLAPRQDQRMTMLDKLPETSPYRQFLKAEIRMHWAFVKLKFGRELSASWDIIKAYKLLDENARRFPDFVPTFKSLGLLHVLVGSAPQNYQWVAKVLGLRGNIQQGLREVNRVVQRDTLFKTEAQLIQILLHAYVLKYSEKQNVELRQLVDKEPDNLLIYFFATTVSMKDGRGPQALEWLERRPTGVSYLAFPFLDYLKGEILLQKGDYLAAEAQLKRFLGQYRGQNFLKDVQWKLFLCQWLRNNDAAARLYIEKVLTVGQTVVESDKAAEKFAQSFLKNKVSLAQKTLLKARLAFDGGYLEEALRILQPLSETQFNTTYLRAEFNYRLGRVHQKRQELDAAVPRYERAVALSAAEQYYFGATSALQLGYIYQSKGQKAKAIAYFRQALDYPKHEYKNSTDNKARAALTEMGVE
jgi:tetratricopeptide (TPR) repeat protein